MEKLQMGKLQMGKESLELNRYIHDARISDP